MTLLSSELVTVVVVRARDCPVVSTHYPNPPHPPWPKTTSFLLPMSTLKQPPHDMPPSLSRLERGAPPPRSKSCVSCIKAKRRCDRELPRCARCANRQLACDYPRQATTPRPPDTDDAAGMEAGPALAAQSITEWSPADAWELTEQPQYFGHDPAFSIGLESLDNLDVALALPWADGEAPPALGASDAQPSLQLLNPPSFDVDAVTERMEHHLGYAIDQIKHAPRIMLLESRTPWCHFSLYSRAMPRAMQGEYQAHTGCREGPSLPSPEEIYATLETTRGHC